MQSKLFHVSTTWRVNQQTFSQPVSQPAIRQYVLHPFNCLVLLWHICMANPDFTTPAACITSLILALSNAHTHTLTLPSKILVNVVKIIFFLLRPGLMSTSTEHKGSTEQKNKSNFNIYYLWFRFMLCVLWHFHFRFIWLLSWFHFTNIRNHIIFCGLQEVLHQCWC